MGGLDTDEALVEALERLEALDPRLSVNRLSIIPPTRFMLFTAVLNASTDSLVVPINTVWSAFIAL